MAKLYLYMNADIDTEYIILENIYGASRTQDDLRQRDLARIAGTSLGMTNVILKRLAKKGYITVKKLNSRNVRYAITLEGANEILHRSYGFFKRTIKDLVYFKDTIEETIHNAEKAGISTVLLVGYSDLEFIIEHCCQRHGMSFLKAADTELAAKLNDGSGFFFYGEGIGYTEPPSPPAPPVSAGNSCYLSELIKRNLAL